MPLHLLSKKSWNVYAPANIERVKRDEEEARRQAIEQEKRSLQSEADDRLHALKQESGTNRTSVKRKLPGEDDTDRDIRLVVESRSTATSTSKQKHDHDSADETGGHFSLIPAPQKKARLDKAAEKDPYTVYLTDATGRGQETKETWYTSLKPEKGKWGDDNPRQQAREAARQNANDPLAAIKKGVKALRENEKERKAWMEQRERDLQEVERLAKKHRHEKKRRKERDSANDDLESLDGFDLDDGYSRPRRSSHHRDTVADHAKESRHHHHHRHHARERRHHRKEYATDGTSNASRKQHTPAD